MAHSNDTLQKPAKVLVAIDVDLLDLEGAYSLTSSEVLRRALIAANREENAELHLVTVLGERDPAPDKAAADLHKLATDEVAVFARNSPPLRIARVVTHVLRGAPAAEIVWLAAKLGVDL